MAALPWEFDDGGRHEAGRKGRTGDCVVRAIAIANEQDYEQVYQEMMADIRGFRDRTRRARPELKSSSPARGVPPQVYRRYLDETGWEWHPTMTIGQGCTVHLARNEVPMRGRLIVRLSRHLTAVVDGVIRDTYDPGRDGTRCVYGYWTHDD